MKRSGYMLLQMNSYEMMQKRRFRDLYSRSETRCYWGQSSKDGHSTDGANAGDVREVFSGRRKHATDLTELSVPRN